MTSNKEIIKRIKKAKKNIKSLPKVKSKKKTVTWVDPVSGWKYGYPKIRPDNITDHRQWFIDNGYPESEVDFGMKYCRMWEEEQE